MRTKPPAGNAIGSKTRGMTGGVWRGGSCRNQNSFVEPLGTALEELVASASQDLVLAAPFIKVRVLDRVLNLTEGTVRVTCITRWRAEEIAAGVSDLDVWGVVRG